MKPLIVYHGSKIKNIKELEPRKRYTPGILGNKANLLIYAAADPAYAAGHAFEWSSDDGIDIYDNEGIVTLEVPKKFKSKLNISICIYELSSKTFTLLKRDSPKSRIYISPKKVKPINAKCFKSVFEAFKFYNGKIIIL